MKLRHSGNHSNYQPGFNGVPDGEIPDYDGGPGDYVSVEGRPNVLAQDYAQRIHDLHAKFEAVQLLHHDLGEQTDPVLAAIHGVYDGIRDLRNEAQLNDRAGSDGAVLSAYHEGRWVSGPIVLSVPPHHRRAHVASRVAVWFDTSDPNSLWTGAVYYQDPSSGRIYSLNPEDASGFRQEISDQMRQLQHGRPHALDTSHLLVDGQEGHAVGRPAPDSIQYSAYLPAGAPDAGFAHGFAQLPPDTDPSDDEDYFSPRQALPY